MGWHVRYIDRELKHELLSPELPTREDAFEAAWGIAHGPHDILALEGPDEETVSVEEIGSWFDRRQADLVETDAVPPAKPDF